MSGRERIVKGAVIEVAHPFVLEDVDLWDGDGGGPTKSWRPGIVTAPIDGTEDPEDGPLVHNVADGVGFQTLTVIDVHRPGRFPTRVYYTRKWTDPSGKTFGKGKLHITVESAFRRIIAGFRVPYQLRPLPSPDEGGRG